MSEVKTQPVQAVCVDDKEAFLRDRKPGSFRLVQHDDAAGELSFWYCCPCGCRAVAPLFVGKGFKPTDGPSWEWDGNAEHPTLVPSVNHIGHWHGWLRAGVWVSC